MSLILDALKKLEQEKAARRTRQMEIRPALTDRKSRPSTAAWRLPALFLGTIILAVTATLGVTWLFSRKVLPPTPPPEEFRSKSATSNPIVPPVPALTPEQHLPTPSAPAKIAAPAPKQPVTPLPAVPPPADLKVTGIAWMEERGVRRAVVNGALVGEGAIVAGAKVLEIRPDQIRFSRDGSSFAISIASSNR
jgi:general secretion pathway protein B